MAWLRYFGGKLVHGLYWLAAILMVIPFFSSFNVYDETEFMSAITQRGVDTMAKIEGLTITTGRRSSQKLELSFSDQKGARHTNTASISKNLTDKLTEGEKIVRNQIAIRYVSDDPTKVLIPEDTNPRTTGSSKPGDPMEAALDNFKTTAPMGLAGLALFLLLFFRRSLRSALSKSPAK